MRKLFLCRLSGALLILRQYVLCGRSLRESSFISRYGGGPSSESQEDLDSEASVDDEDSTSDALREDQENIFGDDQPNIRYKLR